MQIEVSKSSLGYVLVAASSSGVTAILLGDNKAELTRDLKARFPAADIEPATRKTEKLAAKVMQCIENPRATTGRDIPLDLQGTPFQKRVWTALRQVAPGTTASYTDIARKIKRPTATRAVGTAISANPVAVLVPCHRIIRKDGSLSGYRWGVKRKRELLAREQHATRAAA